MAEHQHGGTGSLMEQISTQDNEGSLPPVHLWNPPLCENVDMRIDREGNWYYKGSPIGRKAMVRLFSRVLRYDPDGHHYLVTPIEKIRLVVDEAPFVAVAMECIGSGEQQELRFTTNTGDLVTAGSDHPIHLRTSPRSGDFLPCIPVRNGLQALIHRNIFYRLVDMAVERPGGDGLGVFSAGQFFPLECVRADG